VITRRTRRQELDPYPPLAVREIINNAVAHTDYAVGGASTFVALFSDRLEISSPGTWPPGFSREDFESGMSLRRNKAISRVLTRLEIIEGYGSGFDRITAECRAGGYPQPEWVENGPQIKVVLRPHPSSDPPPNCGAIQSAQANSRQVLDLPHRNDATLSSLRSATSTGRAPPTFRHIPVLLLELWNAVFASSAVLVWWNSSAHGNGASTGASTSRDQPPLTAN
jgi:predicted HTH transcriptional regulator